MNQMIKVGYLLSYDYQYIFNSLKTVYDFADKIVICYDREGKTWAGNHFLIPNEVFEKIKSIDNQNKIVFYSDTFYIEGENPINLDTRQRNMLAQKMGKGGWHIQIDSDEYALNFQKLTSFLQKHSYLLRNPKRTPINFFVKFVTLFKQNEEGFFVITPHTEPCFLITNVPFYTNARMPENQFFVQLNYYLIHQSWARSEQDILQKFQNWGHKNDFNTQKYFEKWKNLNSENYRSYQNFHPLTPQEWKSIEFIKSKNIDEFLQKFLQNHPQKELNFPLKWTKKLKLYLKSWL